MHHKLKLEHFRTPDLRRGWQESIVDAQNEIEDLLELSPSLAGEIDNEIARQLKRAVRLALRDLEDYGGLDPATAAAVRSAGFTREQILGDWFPGGPLPGEERP